MKILVIADAYYLANSVVRLTFAVNYMYRTLYKIKSRVVKGSAETAQLICGFVIEYAKCRFSHDLAQLKLATDYENKYPDQLRSNFAAH